MTTQTADDSINTKLRDVLDCNNKDPFMFMGAYPQVPISEEQAQALQKANKLTWDDVWARKQDLRFTQETMTTGFEEIRVLLRSDHPVKIWTQQDSGLATIFRMPKLNTSWKYQTPLMMHPDLGPLGDMDILVPIKDGVLIKRQPFVNDQIGASHHDQRQAWYVWAGKP